MTQDLPPYARAVGMERAEGGLLRLPFSDRLIGRPGFLHGGVISGLLEVAAMIALQRALGEERPQIKPINVTVDFLRGGLPKVTLASASVSKIGGRVASVDARAWQDDPERPIASAHLNYLLKRD